MKRAVCWTVLIMAAAVLVPGSTLAQTPAGGGSSELVSQLAKEIGGTAKQAEGAAGSLFRLAKSRMTPENFGKVASAVPDMDKLLAAVPRSMARRPAPLPSARRWARRASGTWRPSPSRSGSWGSRATRSRRRSPCRPTSSASEAAETSPSSSGSRCAESRRRDAATRCGPTVSRSIHCTPRFGPATRVGRLVAL